MTHGIDQDRRASDRTKLAVQRNLLAVERTFSAWIRTGLAAVAAGLAIGKLFVFPQLPFLSHTVGAIFVIAGASIFITSMYRYYHNRRKLKLRGVKLIPIWVMVALALALFAAAVFAFVLLVLTYNH